MSTRLDFFGELAAQPDVLQRWRWWPAWLLLASGLALVLVVAADSFAAFGLLLGSSRSDRPWTCPSVTAATAATLCHAAADHTRP